MNNSAKRTLVTCKSNLQKKIVSECFFTWTPPELVTFPIFLITFLKGTYEQQFLITLSNRINFFPTQKQCLRECVGVLIGSQIVNENTTEMILLSYLN